MEQNRFTLFDFEGFKNTGPIQCDSSTLFNFLLKLEWDPAVKSYFQPGMEFNVDYKGLEYLAKADLWVDYYSGSTVVIHFLDSKTIQLYKDIPMLKGKVQLCCHAFNLKYIALKDSD